MGKLERWGSTLSSGGPTVGGDWKLGIRGERVGKREKGALGSLVTFSSSFGTRRVGEGLTGEGVFGDAAEVHGGRTRRRRLRFSSPYSRMAAPSTPGSSRGSLRFPRCSGSGSGGSGR